MRNLAGIRPILKIAAITGALVALVVTSSFADSPVSAQSPARDASGSTGASDDAAPAELKRSREQGAQAMHLLEKSLIGGDGAVLKNLFKSDVKRRLFLQLTEHPRFIPFAVAEVAWLLSMILLQAWFRNVIPWRWITFPIGILVTDLYVTGALVGLPLGIFSKELMPVYKTMMAVVSKLNL